MTETTEICKYVAYAMGEPEDPPFDYLNDPVHNSRFLEWSKDYLTPELLSDEWRDLYNGIKNDQGEAIAIICLLRLPDLYLPRDK